MTSRRGHRHGSRVLVAACGLASSFVWAGCTALDGLSGGAGGTDAAAGDEQVVTVDGGGDGGSGDGQVVAATYRTVVMSDNPIGYWRLDESSGAVAKDEMGLRDGAYVGTVSLGAAGALAGGGDRAIELAGTDGYVYIANGVDFAGGAHFSIEAWVKAPDSGTVIRRVVSKRQPGEGYSLYVLAGAGLVLEMYVGGANAKVSGPLPSSTSYTHVVGTFGGGTMHLFVDGAEVATTSSALQMNPNAGKLSIGAYDGNSDFFVGGLDEVALYAEALPAARVFAHYKAGKGL